MFVVSALLAYMIRRSGKGLKEGSRCLHVLKSNFHNSIKLKLGTKTSAVVLLTKYVVVSVLVLAELLK